MRRLLQKQTQSLQTARVLAKAIRSDIPQSGLDPTYNQVAPQIVIQQSGLEQPSPVAPTATVRQTVPGQKDPIAEELKRIDAYVKHGLLDKTGDGANANIIKLGEQLKKVAEGIKNISTGSGRLGAREIQYDDERLSAIRMQGERYIPGIREALGLGDRGAFSGLKNLISFSPLKDFKMEDIDERSLFGGVIRRKIAERQYAEDQLAMVKTLKGDLRADVRKKKEYQDENGQFSEMLFRQKKIEQFHEQNHLRGEIGKTMEQIDRLKHDEGYTDEQIKKTGLYKTLQQQERELAAADPDRFAREVKEAKKKDIEQRASSIKAPKPVIPMVEPKPLVQPKPSVQPESMQASAMDVSEKESEQMLVISQYVELIKQIEANTRPLKNLETILKSAMDKVITPIADDKADTGITSDTFVDGIDRSARKTTMGSRLKSIGRSAIRLGGMGAAAVAPMAIASIPLLAMKGATEWAEKASIKNGDGELTTTGKVLDIAQESVGGQGLKPMSEMSDIEQLEYDTSTGWWDVFGDKKQQKKKYYEGLIDRGQKFTIEEAKIIERNLDLIIPESSIKLRSIDAQSMKISPSAIEPPQDMGGRVYQESDQLRSIEKTVIQQSAPNIINAPTTNVNQTTNNVTRPPAKNTDSTYREYSKSRFSW